jgi:integrase
LDEKFSVPDMAGSCHPEVNGGNIDTQPCTKSSSERQHGSDDRELISLYGTHSLRRTKATLIYRRTGNLRAVQLLLGHTKNDSTVRYLGIEVDDALAMAEQVDV